MEKRVLRVNTTGTQNMLKATRLAGYVSFVYPSSCAAVTEDVSKVYASILERSVAPTCLVYGESKVTQGLQRMQARC